MIWHSFSLSLTSRENAIFFLLRMHVCEFQPLVRLACNRQNFVRPSFRIFPELEICRHSPVPGFIRGHLVNQLFFERLDLFVEFVLSQRVRHSRKERIYSIVIPKPVQSLLMHTSTARWFIT